MSHQRIRKMTACLCLWLLANTGQAFWPLSKPQEQYGHLMPSREEIRGSAGTALAQAERVTATMTFSQHPTSFAPLRLKQEPKNIKSTGLYRLADEPVTITVVPDSANRSGVMPRLRVDIGRRHPMENYKKDLSFSAPLHEGTHKDQQWRPGLLYLESDETGTDSFDITIEGAVKAPWFKLGRDSQEHWREVIRHEPAPWAELEGERAILTLPSSMIRDLDDPRPVIRFYDEMVADVNALMGLDTDAEDLRDRAPDLPFRFLLRPPLYHDKRVAAYSGYPIRLNWIYHGDPFVWLTPDDLRTRSVVLHTLGFNHGAYRDQLSLPGAEGALADLMEYGWQARQGYALLAQRTNWPWIRLDFHYSYTPWGYPLMWLCHLFDKTWCRYDARIWVPGPYVSWAQKHAFMIQLVSHLSPDFIGLMYSRYRHTPEEELPGRGNPEQQSDFFFEVLCEVTGQDLTLFFRHWKVPVSSDAYARVAAMGYEKPGWTYGFSEL